MNPNVSRLKALGQKIQTRYGVGTIEKGWRNGPIIQYETRVGNELVMATEFEVTLVSDDKKLAHPFANAPRQDGH